MQNWKITKTEGLLTESTLLAHANSNLTNVNNGNQSIFSVQTMM